MSALEDLLLQCFGSVADREKAAAYIEAAPERFQELLDLACSPKDSRAHVVAAWVLEKYSLHRLEVLKTSSTLFSKAWPFKSTEQTSPHDVPLPLLPKERTPCTIKQKTNRRNYASCFDYMLEAEKAAALAFAMKPCTFSANTKIG